MTSLGTHSTLDGQTSPGCPQCQEGPHSRVDPASSCFQPSITPSVCPPGGWPSACISDPPELILPDFLVSLPTPSSAPFHPEAAGRPTAHHHYKPFLLFSVCCVYLPGDFYLTVWLHDQILFTRSSPLQPQALCICCSLSWEASSSTFCWAGCYSSLTSPHSSEYLNTFH